MSATWSARDSGRRLLGVALAVLFAARAAPQAQAQSAPPAPIAHLSFSDQSSDPSPPGTVADALAILQAGTGSMAPIVDPAVAQADCKGCERGLPPPPPPPPSFGGAAGPGCDHCGGEGPEPLPTPPRQCGCSACGGCGCGAHGCYPGHEPCYPCDGDTTFHRFLCSLYECICCPDPCYEPHWLPIADAAFFTEAARPVTQTRLRWDAGVDVVLPDRAEYFWARADGMGKGPKPTAPFFVDPHVNYNDLSLYTEAATGKVSVIFEMPYRSVDPEFAPHEAGFGDMNIGMKTLLFDCELVQVAMIMRTYLPVGDPSKGLGTGHVSLEPSLVLGLCLGPDTFFQGQVAEWIPLGGDPSYEGAILHYHMSLNQVVWRVLPNVPLIGTAEFSGWSFQAGSYTDPFAGSLFKASGTTYADVGAGLRLVVCDRMDFGFAVSSAVTSQHFAEQLYRTEFRFRY
jgi:hypothetical protein